MCSNNIYYFNHDLQDVSTIPDDKMINVVLKVPPDISTNLECVFFNKLNPNNIIGFSLL